MVSLLSDGNVPIQLQHAVPGNLNGISMSKTFRTLELGEYFGDNVTTIMINHDFEDELFRFFNIPFIKDLELKLQFFANIAWCRQSAESASVLPIKFNEFKTPFAEAGFGIGHILFPLNLEFAWKLNHKGKNDFIIGVNTFLP